MVFVLEGLSLAVVIGFLFAMLNRSMTQEHISQINVRQAELRLYLNNRLNHTQARVKEISINNSLKISLLLDMQAKIADIMQTLYPQNGGSTFYVRHTNGVYFPKPRVGHAFLKDLHHFPIREEDLSFSSIDAATVVFLAPIFQQEEIRGHAVGIYKLAEDPQCADLLKAIDDLSLVAQKDARFVDVFSGQSYDLSQQSMNASMAESFSHTSVSDGLPLLVNIQEFPALFLLADNTRHLQKRRTMILKLVLLCLPLLVLTFAVSFLILKRVTSSLDALSRNALHIAETDDQPDLDEANVHHVEFLYLTRAFNKVLLKVRMQTEALQAANRNLQKQIEERRQIAEALRDSEAQLRSLQTNIPIGLYRRTLNGRFVFVNPKMISIFGFNSDEEMSMVPVSDLYCSLDDYRAVMQQLEAEGTIQSRRTRCRRKDGSKIWCAVHLTQTIDPKSGSTYIDGALLDISEHIKIEEEKQKLEAQLRQAQKMEAIGTLAGGIAHDFNNILGAIIGFCELAQDDAEQNSLQYDNLNEAITAAQRASDLVKQILTFARQSEVEKRPVNFKIILNESLKMLRAIIPSTVSIQTAFNCDRTILADPTQLHQIIVNLCTNAAHAMRSKGGVLTIGLNESEVSPGHNKADILIPPGSYVRLTVQDTGHGMTREVQDRIFDPYFTTKEQGDGTGMGLSVVQGIVSALRGAILFESIPDKGTTFDVFLPAMEKQNTPIKADIDSIVGGDEHILLVDDEKALTQMSTQMLERIGYQVTVCNSGVEALALFSRAPESFDLIISDLTMPQMTGRDLALEIAKIRSDIPLILCTGYSEHVTDEMVAAIGVEALLHKPLARNELAVTIRKALDNQAVKSQPKIRRA